MPETNLQKLKLEVNSVETTVKDILGKMNIALQRIEEDITRNSQTKATTEKSLQETEVKLSKLKTDLDKLTSEGAELSSKAASKSKEFEVNEEQISELKHQKKTLDTEIANAEIKNRELSNEVIITEGSLDKVKSDLVQVQATYDEKVKSIEKEVNETNTKALNRENSFKILRILLEDEYIRDNIYNVMKTVDQPGIDSLEKLQRASAVSMPEVKEALHALNVKGIINFDPATGEYSVLKDLNI